MYSNTIKKNINFIEIGGNITDKEQIKGELKAAHGFIIVTRSNSERAGREKELYRAFVSTEKKPIVYAYNCDQHIMSRVQNEMQRKSTRKCLVDVCNDTDPEGRNGATKQMLDLLVEQIEHQPASIPGEAEGAPDPGAPDQGAPGPSTRQ